MVRSRKAQCLLTFVSFVLIPAHSQVASTTVCDITQQPDAFDGKTVRVRATVISGFEVFAIRDTANDCGQMWLSYSGGGPTASVSTGALTPDLKRKSVELRHDRAFNKFQKLLVARMYPRSRGAICLSCGRYEVTATMTGRVDYAGEHPGFGHLNGYRTQFVLQAISEVSGKDVSSGYDLKLFSPTKIRFPTAYLSGKVLGPTGERVADAEVNVHSTEEVTPDAEELSGWTNEKGRFKVEVPPGSYVIGVNLESPPSPAVPFPPTYFPDTKDPHYATVLKVADKDRRDDLNIKLRRALTIKRIPLKAVWPDGKPVVDANVCLMQQNDPTGMVGVLGHTDGGGRFDLIGFEGIDYVVQANIYMQTSYKPYCARNVVVYRRDQVSSPISMVFDRSGESCRGLGYTVEDAEPWALKPK